MKKPLFSQVVGDVFKSGGRWGGSRARIGGEPRQDGLTQSWDTPTGPDRSTGWKPCDLPQNGRVPGCQQPGQHCRATSTGGRGWRHGRNPALSCRATAIVPRPRSSPAAAGGTAGFPGSSCSCPVSQELLGERDEKSAANMVETNFLKKCILRFFFFTPEKA